MVLFCFLIFTFLFDSIIKIKSSITFKDFNNLDIIKDKHNWTFIPDSLFFKTICSDFEIFGNIQSSPNRKTIKKKFSNLNEYLYIEFDLSFYIVDNHFCNSYDYILMNIDNKILFKLNDENKNILKNRNDLNKCGVAGNTDYKYKISIKKKISKKNSHTIKIKFRRSRYSSITNNCYYGFRDFSLTFKKNCVLDCLKCTNDGLCLTCKYNFYRLNENKCEKCHSSCKKCNGKLLNNCISCKSKFYYHNGGCYENCPEGYFKYKRKCVKCNSTCKNCKYSSNNCISCDSKKYYLNKKCYIKCPVGYFKENGKCSRCASNCENCEHSSRNCLSCASKRYFFKGKCYGNCPINSFLENNKRNCSSCINSCQNCKEANICLWCKKDHI